MTAAHHLAQVNVGRFLYDQAAPELAEFFSNLAPVNAIADAAPGFVWRLVGDGDDATDLRPDADDARLLINLSLWRDLESLGAFVYRSGHREIMRRRREWFEPMPVFMALWWVPIGHRPTPAEALRRLATLRELGPTPAAFTFRQPFPPPSGAAVARPVLETCEGA